MPCFSDWLMHRAMLVRLTWPHGLADAVGVAPATLQAICIRGNLKKTGRGTRGYLARALAVSLRDMEALADGKIDWIDDDRMLRFDRPAAVASPPPPDAVPEPVYCVPGRGIPILGRILPRGKVQPFDDWTSEDGPRLPVRYPGLPDAFSLELSLGISIYPAGDCLIFRLILPGELREGELTLVTLGGCEGESELRIVRRPETAGCILEAVTKSRDERKVDIGDILRAARVLGNWNRASADANG